MAMPNKAYWDKRMIERFRPVENLEKEMGEKYVQAYNKVFEDYTNMLKPYKLADGSYNFERLERDMFYSRASSAKVGRYQGLLDRMDKIINNLGVDQESSFESLLMNTYQENYHELLFEVGKANGHQLQFNQLDPRRLKQTVHTAWAKDGHEFSDRIWHDKQLLSGNLRKVMDNAIASGENPRNTARLLANATNNSYSNARRVIRTETTAIVAESDKATYDELGMEKYTYNASFDDRTSDVCGDMDGETFYLNQMSPGTNAPPMHPNCRSTIEAVPITKTQLSTKYARGADGKPIRIPQSMTFTEYKKKVLDID